MTAAFEKEPQCRNPLLTSALAGRFYELNAKDNVAPALRKIRANITAMVPFLKTLDAGAGGVGFLNRLVFGGKEFDATSKQYLGRVGGLVAPLRAMFSSGDRGEGVVNKFLFGTKVFDAQTGKFLARAGGLVGPLRKMFDSGSGGSGIINRFLFGEKQTDAKTGAFMGRLGGAIQNVRALAGGLSSAAGSALAFSKVLGGIGLGLVGAGVGLGAPLFALFKGGIDRGAEIANLSKQYGVPIAVMNRLKYAADQAKVSLEEVMTDETGRFSKLIAEAPPIDAGDARAAAEMQREFADATLSLQNALLPLGAALAPYVKMLAQFVKENATAIAVLAPLAAGIVGLGIVFTGTAVVMAGFAASLAGIIAAVAAAPVAIAAVGATVVGAGVQLAALAAGVGVVGAGFLTMTDTGRQFGRDMKEAFGTAKTAWGGLTAALAKGDLEGAFGVVTSTLGLAWADLVLRLETGWADFKALFIDGWNPMLDGATDQLVTFGSWVNRIFTQIGGTIENVFKGIARSVIDTALDVAKALDTITPGSVLTAGIREAEGLRDKIGPGRNIKAETDAIESERDAALQKLREERDAAQKVRDEARGKDIGAAETGLAEARQRFEAAIARANVPRVPGAEEKLGPIRQGLLGTVSVKGSFTGAALNQQFGVSDKANRSNELLDQMVKLQRTNPEDTAKALAPLVALRVTR